ncbi:conserved hypothetical protein [Trichophyton verrucosum HKI 0517]|uniref:Uncharacterized protein n=1 Tax=Trichophyton verrucosum (strain HKI 0517) TaxID=663202 RepID=D4D658_TRIVH|nr:uncharacterized protein TRV_02581 [Trichophyton verrucosum HKI 0517]EFE42629.1 conserved hypothetical protein [Trichophyton verrucosum HKI 0517]
MLVDAGVAVSYISNVLFLTSSTATGRQDDGAETRQKTAAIERPEGIGHEANRSASFKASSGLALPALRLFYVLDFTEVYGLFTARSGLEEEAMRYIQRQKTAAAQPATHDNSSVRDVIAESDAIISGTTIPSEESVIEILKKSQAIVDAVQSVEAAEVQTDTKPKKDAISSLLNLDDEEEAGAVRKTSQTQKKEPPISTSATAISNKLNELLQDPKVFISPEILKLYTSIQCQLKKADYIPTIFTLYANKPSPRSSGGTITYSPSNPKSPQNAIPPTIANDALEVAMEQRNLSLALAIIDTAFCTPAFYRSKIIRQASFPFLGVVATPPAAWAIASYLSTLQNTMDVSTARGIAFSAILAYVTFTASVGLVAAATSNDHMRRVVWIPGTALRSRWLREEERQALDRVAQTWGFSDPLMRGEEVGEEWESLREFIGMRGMILDKTDHMEGME